MAAAMLHPGSENNDPNTCIHNAHIIQHPLPSVTNGSCVVGKTDVFGRDRSIVHEHGMVRLKYQATFVAREKFMLRDFSRASLC